MAKPAYEQVVRANVDSDDEDVESMDGQRLGGFQRPKSRSGGPWLILKIAAFLGALLAMSSLVETESAEQESATEVHGEFEFVEEDTADTTPSKDSARPKIPQQVYVDPEEDNHEEAPTNVVSVAPKLTGSVAKNLGLKTCPQENAYWTPEFPKPDECFNFNILLLKGQKTGSSTTGGVARRIAARMGVGCVDCGASDVWEEEPAVIAPHIFNAIDKLEKRNRKLKTFVFGFFREPISRCLSQFYHFRVSRGNAEPNLKHMMETGSRTHNYLTNYYGLRKYRDKIDFLGVTDRYQESMLIVGYKLGVTMGDLLYTKAKDSSQGVKDVTGKRNAVLAKHVPIHEQPQEIQDYFYGPFLEHNKEDVEHYNQANKDLDDLIDMIGREKFEEKVEQYKQHLKNINEECDSFDSDGNMKENIKCYWRDNGCNYDCFDRYAVKHNLWSETLSF